MNKNKNKEIIKKECGKNITEEQKQRYREALKTHKKNIGKNIEKLNSDIEKI